MKRLRITLTLLVPLALLSLAQPAHAQRRGPYRPLRPTLSPYLNLSRGNVGPLDNYHTFVRPQLRLLATLNRQDNLLLRQRAGIQLLGQEMLRFDAAQQVRPTGTGSTFMNYSHYYPYLTQHPAHRRR